MTLYNDKLDADDQITMEERIASHIYEGGDISEESANELGKEILKMVLTKFRPDLLERSGAT